MQNYNEVIKQFISKIDQKYSNDNFTLAARQGRIGIRTFYKDALTADLNINQTMGSQGLEAISTRIQKPEEYPQGLSFSILPTKPFGRNIDEKIGILVTLPDQKDIKNYKQFTNKDFIKKNNIDPELVKQLKATFTRVGYFDKDDLYAEYTPDGKHYRPAKRFEQNIPTYKNQALNYQSFAKNSSFHNNDKMNEALVKIRSNSTICLIAFDLEGAKYLLNAEAKNILPNPQNVQYAVFDIETNTIKIIDEEIFYNHRLIRCTEEINVSELNSKINIEDLKENNFQSRVNFDNNLTKESVTNNKGCVLS